MSLQEELVTADSIMPDCRALPVLYIVKEQHMIPVRQYSHDFFSVHISYLLALISLSLSLYLFHRMLIF
jgi:hypothetical protein